MSRTVAKFVQIPFNATIMLAVIAWSGYVPTASGSALFDGTNADLWVIDPANGQITSYDYGQWLEQFTDANYPLSGNEEALINNAPNSSQTLSPGQPGFSLAGLGGADFDQSQTAEGMATLRLQPPSGTYTQTIPVKFLVSAAEVDSGTLRLRSTINGNVRVYPLTDEGLATAGAQKQDGYYVISDYLVRDTAEGQSHLVQAEVLNASGLVVGSANATYQLASDDPDGFRRDSDGDGIPDLVEAAIGMDPFDSDWFSDADGDGWSQFDLWLREDYLDSATGLPIDSDSDGWSDFDEALRGTNPADPAGVEPTALPVTTEQERQFALRFKDFPVARRLYEVEYVINGQLAPQPVSQDMTWSRVTAATLAGETTYRRADLLSVDDLAQAGLATEDVVTRRRLAPAETDLQSDLLPDMRLPAGNSQVLRAAHQSGSGAEAVTQVYKLWLSRTADADPARHLAENGVGTWTTVEEWKQGFIDYLGLALVEQREPSVDLRSTEVVALMEAAYSRESRLNNLAPYQLFGWPERKTPAELADKTEQSLTTLQRKLASGQTAGWNLDDALLAVENASGSGAALAPTAAWIRDQVLSPVAGKATDLAIAESFLQSFDLSEEGCFVRSDVLVDIQADPEAWADFQADCPDYYTDTDLEAWQAQDRERVYQVRLHWLPGAPAALADASGLLQGANDSDADTETNSTELAAPLGSLTFPWLADFDGDGSLDGEDLCPRDPINGCNSEPDLPGVTVEGTAAVDESGVALVAVSLDRVRSEDVIVSFQVIAADGDTATPGVDFLATTGSVRIPAGERVVLIAVDTLADSVAEDTETFTIEITDVTGASLVGNGLVAVSISDEPADSAPVVLSTPRYTAIVGEILRMTSADLLSYVEEPDGQTLAITGLLSYPEGQLDGDEAEQTLLYLSPAGTEQQISGAGNQSFYVTVASATEVLYNDADTEIGQRRLFSHNIETLDRQSLVDDSGNPVVASDVIAAPSGRLAYIEQSSTNSVHVWQQAEALRTLREFPLPFYQSAVNPLTGDLYTCDEFGSGVWQRTDLETLTSEPIDLSCSNIPAFGAELNGQYCFATDRTIDCTLEGGGMARAASFASGSISGMQAVNGNLLVFHSGANSVSTDFPQNRTLLLTPDFAQKTLLEYPSERYQSPETLRLSDGTWLLSYAEGGRARLYRWSGLDSDPLELLDIGDVALADGNPGDLLEMNGAVYWLRQSDSANRTVEMIDPDSGQRRVLFGVAEANRWVPLKLLAYGSRLHVMVATDLANSDMPQCDLWRGGETTEPRAVVRNVNCNQSWKLAEQLLLEHFEISFELGGDYRYLKRYGAPVFTGQTGFRLQVSDSTGNTVELPVEINVQSAQ